MKTISSTDWRTESDCGVHTHVSEGRADSGEKFREIVVKVDANMTADEARKLIVDVQHAVALADQPKPVPPEDKCSCAKPNGVHREWCSSHNYQLCACGQLVSRYDVGLHSMCAERYGELTEVPAVSEDQPKPRMWHKGDVEPPADVKLLQATNGDQLMRFLDSRWGWLVLGGISRFYNTNTLRPWHRVDWADHTQLSEVDFPAASEADV